MSDRLDVIPAPLLGVEPEEAPTRRVVDLNTNISLAPTLPEVVESQGRPALRFDGSIPVATVATPMTSEMPMGEVAALLRHRCVRCLYFRSDLWRETMRIWASAPEKSGRRIGLDRMILQIARACTDGGTLPSLMDLKLAERDLRTWGICEALTDERKDLFFVHPEACCPDEIDRYKDGSREARKAASKVFDRLMRLAQGRT